MSKLEELLKNKTELTHDELAEFMSELALLLKEVTSSGVNITYCPNGGVSLAIGSYCSKYEPACSETVSIVRLLAARKLIKDTGPILTSLRETLRYNTRRVDEVREDISSRKKALAEIMERLPKYRILIEELNLLSEIVDPKSKDILED